MTTITAPTAVPTAGQPLAGPRPLVRWFQDLTRSDIGAVGGKGANLGEMTRAGLPVPPGFVVTVDAYRRFAEANALDAQVAERLARLNVDDSDQLRATSDALQSFVRRAPIPDDVPSLHLQHALVTAIRIGHDTDTVAASGRAARCSLGDECDAGGIVV